MSDSDGGAAIITGVGESGAYIIATDWNRPTRWKKRTDRNTSANNFKGIDKSTPALFLSATNGQVYPNAKLEVCTTGSTSDTNICLFEVGLKDVSVQSTEAAATADGRPQEMLSLLYEEITWTYSALNPKDPKAAPTITSAGWDLLRNVPTSGK